MKCRNPFLRGVHAFPCGQCMPCRYNKRREWTHRIMLEMSMYEDNAWLGLSYDEEHLPRLKSGVGTLKPKDLQDFLKRLRRSYEPLRFRFYAVGEYGDDTWRPHYHVCLFNFPTCVWGRTRHRRRSCCVNCDLVRQCWTHGSIDLSQLTVESAQYTAGYVTKKMSSDKDRRLEGRFPEFSRMSLRPGIGADFMCEVASTLLTHNLEVMDDVPNVLRHGKRILPLGRYLRRRLRVQVGRSPDAPQSTLDKASEELRPLYESEFDNPSNSSVPFGKRVKALLTGVDDERVRQMVARQRIRKKRGVL